MAVPGAETPRDPSLPPQLEPAPSLTSLQHDETIVEQSLGELDLSNGHANGVSLRGVRLHGTDLSGSELPELDLTDAQLRGCNLANLRTPRGNWLRIVADGCRMTGLTLSAGALCDVTIRDARVDLASFGGCRLRRVTFENCRLAQTDFLEAQLDSVRFTHCDLTEADFRGARLRRCELRGNRLDGLRGAEQLRGCALRWPDIVDSAGLWAAALGIEVLDD